MSSKAAASSGDSNPQSGQGRPLPRKEGDLFKNVVKFYESKSYKKGLKNADAILRRFPNHGETLCMKGLIVNAMASGSQVLRGDGGKAKGGGDKGEGEPASEGDKKKEAIELVKRGLMMDMRSHVCWHVYGLLHRSSQNYAEAIKAYKQALRIDPENLQILRDMGLLQIQQRDLGGFRDTRLRILTLRPNSKVHWLTYALSCHVNGDAEGTVGVLDSYMGTLDKDDSPEFKKNFDSSELAMYKNQVLSETGGGDDGLEGVRKALAHLDEIKDIIVDRTGWLMAQLSYQLRLGRFEDAKDTVFLLFDRGSTEDHRVHGAYMCALLECDGDTCNEVANMKGTGTLATLRPLMEDERAVLLEAYSEGDQVSANGEASKDSDGEPTRQLASKYPRSAAIRRIRLTLLPPDSPEFERAVDKYCRRQIIKGVPSLGADLSSMYLLEAKRQPISSSGDGKVQIRYALAQDPADVGAHPVHLLLVRLVDGYISSLSGCNAFPDDEDGTEHPPSALLWAWYLRAILHEQAGEYSRAVALVDVCIEHTPTAVDFYELKGRLLECGGDIKQAADVVDAGRDLDHQDRYINNQATKTLLRAGREDDARKRIALFTRHEGDPERNLYDMQCTWYELELADCWRRKGELGKSLRKYMAVVRHYEDFHEDQFDFHMYCIRKVTLRSYCKLLKFEDELWGMPHYGRAAEEVIRMHLHLADNPFEATEDSEPDYSKMTSAERKKAKNIARKKKAKAKAGKGGGGGANSSAKNNGKKKKGKPHIVDEDPEGKELLALDHLEEARKYAAILVRHAPRRISAWALQYDVSVRRGKMLLALQALFKMRSVDPKSHQLFSDIVDFSQRLSSNTAEGGVHPASKQVISDEFPELLGYKMLADFVRSVAEEIRADSLSSLPMRVAVARAMLGVAAESAKDAVMLILESKLDVRCVTIETCREAIEFVNSAGSDADKEQMRLLVAKRFPFAKSF